MTAAQGADGVPVAAELAVVRAAAGAVGVDRSAVIIATSLQQRYPLAGSDPALRWYGDLQQTYDEGPGVELFTTGDRTILADLPQDAGRWPALAAAAGTVPFRALAVLALAPVDAPTGQLLGLLAVARNRPEPFTGASLAALRSMAVLLHGMISAKLPGDPDVWPPDHLNLLRDPVPIAAGFLMRRHDIGYPVAYRRLCLRARTEGRTVRQLAEEIIRNPGRSR